MFDYLRSTDSTLPGFSVHGILQARILEWVTISFSRGSSRHRYKHCQGPRKYLRSQFNQRCMHYNQLSWALAVASYPKMRAFTLCGKSKQNFASDTTILSYTMSMLVAQLCLTLQYHMDCSPSGSSIHGVLQARILEWVAIFFSRELPDPGIKASSPTLQADALLSELLGKPTLFLEYRKK